MRDTLLGRSADVVAQKPTPEALFEAITHLPEEWNGYANIKYSIHWFINNITHNAATTHW